MPLYKMKCDNCNFEKEVICSYGKANDGIACDKCNCIMKICVVKNGGFRVNGANAANGYTPDHINYDGSNRPW